MPPLCTPFLSAGPTLSDTHASAASSSVRSSLVYNHCLSSSTRSFIQKYLIAIYVLFSPNCPWLHVLWVTYEDSILCMFTACDSTWKKEKIAEPNKIINLFWKWSWCHNWSRKGKECMMKVCYTAMAKKYVSYKCCVRRHDVIYVVQVKSSLLQISLSFCYVFV